MLYILVFMLMWFVGAQIQCSELKLLSGRYNYKIQRAQLVTYGALLLALLVLLARVRYAGLCAAALPAGLLFVCCYAVGEWLLARWSPQGKLTALAYRLLIVGGGALALDVSGNALLLPALLAGLYFRNSPFGCVSGKPFFVAYQLQRKPFAQPEQHFADTKRAFRTAEAQPVIDVTALGVHPDTDEDVLDKVQMLIDEIGQQGGGCLYFPAGRYLFNKAGRKAFLQINHSHVTLAGETDEHGRLLTELVNCGTTVQGDKNPWLSPFFITTGERLQPSNQFWGLQFRKPSGLRTESSSLSDPGSDGYLLTPPLATRVAADAMKGSRMLTVEHASAVGKYILLGMYNTTPDGQLIKEILGVDQLRPEWLSARRAGPEEAPSFQWLTEVKAVVDEHTIELVCPLQRDCLTRFTPEIYNVEMLEDIHLRDLRISSTWNGLFRHHGFPLYYSIARTQEMDYGWNAINMKRSAYSSVEHVEICNFSNPLYVQDSRQVTVADLTVRGYDGHQGIKVYCHTSDCLFERIKFYCHFADMMGGEGNAYGNVFRHVSYLNPTFKPVDYDFHGFSEGPMSPPAYNLFEQVAGFRYIKGAGAVHNQPACAAGNVWRANQSEGERKGGQPFFAQSYRVRSGAEKYATAIGYTLIMMLKRKNRSLPFVRQTFVEKLNDIGRMSIPHDRHSQFFPGSEVDGVLY